MGRRRFAPAPMIEALSKASMDVLIKTRIFIDSLTKRISDYCAKRNVRRVLITIKSVALLYLLYELYLYGIGGGTTTLFVLLFTITLTSFFTRNREKVDASLNQPMGDESPEMIYSSYTKQAGGRRRCDKCGLEVSINYGDAYNTLCEKCA